MRASTQSLKADSIEAEVYLGGIGCELVDEPAKLRADATIMVGVDGEAAHRSKVSYSARSQEVWEGRGGTNVWQSQRQLARKG